MEATRVVSLTEAERQLADIRSNLREASHLNRQFAQGQKQVNTQLHDMGMKVAAAADSVRHLTEWHKGQADAFEVLATSSFKQHMTASSEVGGLEYEEDNVIELDLKHLKVLGQHKPHPMYSADGEARGFEWDGVLIGKQNGIQTIFLVEAKTHVIAKHVTNTSDDGGMVERMQRTAQYLDKCAAGNFEDASASVKAQAHAWLLDHPKKPDFVIGVLIAHGFTQSIFDLAKKHGIWCAYQNGTGFTVKRP